MSDQIRCGSTAPLTGSITFLHSHPYVDCSSGVAVMLPKGKRWVSKLAVVLCRFSDGIPDIPSILALGGYRLGISCC